MDFFVKGANLPPLHSLPEGATTAMVDETLEFAAQSHMNMLRIWGQGMYQSGEEKHPSVELR